MKADTSEENQVYLNPTEYCDCDNDKIINQVKVLLREDSTNKDKAIRIFYYVRDNIQYGLDISDTKASKTLKNKYGNCVTKTNLQIALLRAAGIPSRYHQVVLNREILKGFVPKRVFDNTDERIWYHPWCECLLSGNWVANDASFDENLYESLCGKGVWDKRNIPTIDWDGETDLIPVKYWLLEEVRTHANYDAVCREIIEFINLPKPFLKMVCHFSNNYINKIRKS
jgi:transglutaminase-like putative cysteine protease